MKRHSYFGEFASPDNNEKQTVFTNETHQHAAQDILRYAYEAIKNRASIRDLQNGERSMSRTVAAFNAITGHKLSETDGWHFMEILKLARSTAGSFHADDHIDRAAYAALACESASKES